MESSSILISILISKYPVCSVYPRKVFEFNFTSKDLLTIARWLNYQIHSSYSLYRKCSHAVINVWTHAWISGYLQRTPCPETFGHSLKPLPRCTSSFVHGDHNRQRQTQRITDALASAHISAHICNYPGRCYANFITRTHELLRQAGVRLKCTGWPSWPTGESRRWLH